MTERETITTLNAIKFMLDNDQYSDDVESALDTAIAALEKQGQDRWTPVKENPKKPKYQYQFDTYLVYTKYERFGIADYFADGSWIGYDIDGDQINGDEITAWRPLPEPYQEDKA